MPQNPHRETVGRMCRRQNLPKSRRLYFERVRLNAAALEHEEVSDYFVQAQVPEAWDTLEQDIDVDEPKEKVTLYLDASVAKFYKAMGRGYQPRINRVLATFAQMRIAQVKRLGEMLEDELDAVARLRAKAGAPGIG